MAVLEKNTAFWKLDTFENVQKWFWSFQNVWNQMLSIVKRRENWSFQIIFMYLCHLIIVQVNQTKRKQDPIFPLTNHQYCVIV